MEEVSVLIPTHNRAHLIAETLKCILDQTYQAFEIIIIDDGSTDNTEEVVNSFTDSRIRYHKYARIGSLAKLRNLAVTNSSKPFIAVIDSDDLWAKDKLEKCVSVCVSGNYDICICDCIEFKGVVYDKESRGQHLNKKEHLDI